MGDGLQLHFVLLLCLKFCHGMNFFVQEALKTVREGDTFNIYSDPMEKKNVPCTSETRKFTPRDEKYRS